MRHGLGRIPSPPDARDYKMATLLDMQPIPQKRVWNTDRTLDQGQTPHCVGFSWAGWGAALPVRTPYKDADGHAIYRECKVLDGEELAENGSTVRSGAKAMIKRTRVKAYYFAQTFYEAKEFVGNHGPVVLGIDWYEWMSEPVNGIIRPGGNKQGGHAILWVGIDGKYGILKNSWGSKWGRNGNAYILLTDISLLLANRGEACAAVENPYAQDKPAGFFSGLLDWLR